MTRAQRLAELRFALAHYQSRAKEAFRVTGDRDWRNPFAGLAAATERVIARIESQPEEAECSYPSSDTSDPRQLELMP